MLSYAFVVDTMKSSYIVRNRRTKRWCENIRRTKTFEGLKYSRNLNLRLSESLDFRANACNHLDDSDRRTQNNKNRVDSYIISQGILLIQGDAWTRKNYLFGETLREFACRASGSLEAILTTSLWVQINGRQITVLWNNPSRYLILLELLLARRQRR